MPTGSPAVHLGMFTALPSPRKELAEPRSCCPPCPRVPALVCDLHLSLSCCSLLKLAAQLALCNTKEGRDFRDLWVIFFFHPHKAPLATDLEDYAWCHVPDSPLCFKRERGSKKKKWQTIAWYSLWFFMTWCVWLCEEARDQPLIKAQEKTHAITTAFHLFESSAFDSIYCWLNQDVNSRTDS